MDKDPEGIHFLPIRNTVTSIPNRSYLTQMKIQITVACAEPICRGPEAVQADGGRECRGEQPTHHLHYSRPAQCVRLALGPYSETIDI